MDDGVMNVEILSQALRMPIILHQRILERKGLAVERLSPVALIFGTEYPPGDILGFYNKHAKGRNDEVVNLCCAIRCGNNHVVESLIQLRIQ